MRSPLFRLALAALVLATPAPAQEPKKDAPPESATDPRSRGSDDWWIRSHEQFLERLKPGTAEVIFLGDSITQGWGGGGKPVWDRFYGPRKAVNLGIGGDRTQHVLWRLDHGELDGIHPKVAIIMIGTNNISSNPPDEIAAGIKLIVGRIRDRLPRTKVLLLGIFPRSQKPDARRDRVRAVNDQIKGFDDGQFVRFLDLAPTFLNPDGTISKDVMPDYLHLTPRGYRLWAEAIEPTLWEMMEGK